MLRFISYNRRIQNAGLNYVNRNGEANTDYQSPWPQNNVQEQTLTKFTFRQYQLQIKNISEWIALFSSLFRERRLVIISVCEKHYESLSVHQDRLIQKKTTTFGNVNKAPDVNGMGTGSGRPKMEILLNQLLR